MHSVRRQELRRRRATSRLRDRRATVFVNAIAENGGRAVGVSEHGALLGRKAELGGLPFLPVNRLAQLRRNGYLSVEREGADFLVGLGERARVLAAMWEIALPE